MKNLFTGVLSFLFLTTLFSINLFSQTKRETIKGNGDITTRTYSVSGFSKIDLGGAFKVTLQQGSNEEMKVEMDENLQQYVRHEVRDGKLKVYMDKDFSISSNVMNLLITYKNISALSLSGATTLKSNSVINSDRLKLDMSGASGINAEIIANELDVDLSGASKIKLKGKASKIVLNGSGASLFDAFELAADKVSLDLSGVSSIKVNVKDELNIDASGQTSVTYEGKPVITKNLSGFSSVRRR